MQHGFKAERKELCSALEDIQLLNKKSIFSPLLRIIARYLVIEM